MNTKILQKCVDELKQDKPKIDYVLGMLESVIELSGATVLPVNNTLHVQNFQKETISATGSDFGDLGEGSGLLAAYNAGPVATLKQ